MVLSSSLPLNVARTDFCHFVLMNFFPFPAIRRIESALKSKVVLSPTGPLVWELYILLQ